MLFEKKITTTKRNHRYYGPTESKKFAVTLEEIYVDMHNIYGRFNTQNNELDAVASGYLVGSGTLLDIDSSLRDMEGTMDKNIYIQATQDAIY